LIAVELNKRTYYQYLGFLKSQALFTDQFQGLEQFIMPAHQIPTFDDFTLNIPNKLPLGKRVEYFFEYFIRENKEYKLLKNNIQIIQNDITLGELDYIIEDIQSKQKYHVELIYKYYLYLENQENEVNRFIGPNFDDSLEKRVTKLQSKQLPLLFKDETQSYLNNMDVENIIQKVCFRANIFLPFESIYSEFNEINPLCIQGVYVKAKQFLDKKDDNTLKKYSYFFPEKQDWLIDIKYCDYWFSYEEILTQIQAMLEQKRAALLWMKKDKKYQSLFLVFM